MRVTFLGTGTSTGVPVPTCDCAVCRSDDPRDSRLRPSIRVEWEGASVLIDTSTDLRLQALRHGIDRVDAVFYTHSHADHVLGLDTDGTKDRTAANGNTGPWAASPMAKVWLIPSLMAPNFVAAFTLKGPLRSSGIPAWGLVHHESLTPLLKA